MLSGINTYVSVVPAHRNGTPPIPARQNPGHGLGSSVLVSRSLAKRGGLEPGKEAS